MFEGRRYTPVIADEYQWSAWTNPKRWSGGGELIAFLDEELFPYLRALKGEEGRVIREMFAEAPSKMLKDGGILRDAIEVINAIQFQTADDIHTVSYLYESTLAKLGREGGMGGEFYTPRPVIEFIVKMVNPRIGQTIYDPAMGSAGFLVEAHRHIKDALGDRITIEQEQQLQRRTVFGQEKKPLPFLLGCMNLVLHGVLSPAVTRRNTLADDVRKFSEKDRYDVILTNPPFGGTEHESVTANFRYPSKATSITFLQHIMEKTRRGGRVGMVIDEGVLFKTNERAFVETKKELLEKFNLHTVVSLPAGVFANAVSSGTGPKTSLLFFDREMTPTGEPAGTKEIWYYEVEAVGFSLTKTQRPIAENDLPDCLEQAKTRAVSAKSWRVPAADIIARGYDLSAHNPNRADDYEHRSPEALIADIIAKEERVLTILTEIQELLDAREVTAEAEAAEAAA
jgi:type I restriction enzyme M protein